MSISSASPGMLEAPDTYISRLLNENKIMIFTRAEYRFHNMRLENHMQPLQEKYTIAYLDQLHDEGKVLEKALFEKVGRNDLPFVFVHGKFINSSDFINAFHDGCIGDWMHNYFPDVDYDLIIVAENPSMVSVAKTAKKLQKKVVMCDNLVPTDALLYNECIVRLIKHFEPSEDIDYTWSEAVKFISNVATEMKDYRRQVLSDVGVDLVSGSVSFINGHELKVGNLNHNISGKNILLALDKRSLMPKNLSNLDKVKAKFTPESLFLSSKPPGKTLILGNSFMSLQCACVLQFLGVEVALLCTRKLMKHYDQELVRFILDELINSGVTVDLECNLKYIREANSKIYVKYKSHIKFHKATYDTILLTPSLKFNSSNLNLSNVGIKVHPKSKHIIVNESDQTSVCSVYAVGSVVHGRPRNISMMATAGRLLLDRLYAHKSKLMDYRFIPNIPVTWSSFEYGYVGMPEEKAIDLHGIDNIIVYTARFLPLEAAISGGTSDEKPEDERKHFAKLICLKPEETVIGLHMASKNMSNLLFGYTLALKKGLKKSHFDKAFSVLFSNGNVFTKLSHDLPVPKKEDINETLLKLILKE